MSSIKHKKAAVDAKRAKGMLKLMELREEHDDIRHGYANFDISAAEVERLAH